jgi:hypothetical protein
MKESLILLPNFPLILCCFKVRTTLILFSFENFRVLRFKVMFWYYGKMDFCGCDDCKGFCFC